MVLCVAALVAFGCGKSQLDDKPTAKIEAPAEAKPEAKPDPAKAAPAAKVGAAAPVVAKADRPDPLEKAVRDLVLDPERSSIGFVGKKITGEHEGSFSEIAGTATLRGYKPTGMKLAVQTDSLTADHPDLTNHLKGPDFFNAAKYPSGRFVSTGIRPGAEGTATHTITGELSLMATTKRISFPATIVVTDAGATGLAEFKINRKDFGIVYPGRPDDLIADEVLLKLNLAFLDKKYVK